MDICDSPGMLTVFFFLIDIAVIQNLIYEIFKYT